MRQHNKLLPFMYIGTDNSRQCCKKVDIFCSSLHLISSVISAIAFLLWRAQHFNDWQHHNRSMARYCRTLWAYCHSIISLPCIASDHSCHKATLPRQCILILSLTKSVPKPHPSVIVLIVLQIITDRSMWVFTDYNRTGNVTNCTNLPA